MKTFHITGVCHIDLAWLADEEQYSDYLEQMTVILLDLLEQNPDMTYLIEQAYHYRSLKARRPDLIERLKKHVEQGRIEVVGGQLSLADSNMPCAESFVRNQLMGLNWFKCEMDADVETAWLFDAFGSHAQMPQLLASFGLRQMMASRFGGNKRHDLFWIEGLDGTKTMIAGRDLFSLNLPKPEKARVFLSFTREGKAIDALFQKALRAQDDGPHLVCVYQEWNVFPSRYIVKNARELQKKMEKQGEKAFFSRPRDFFRDVREQGLELPCESADLNPEFTGTYSQRIEIRLHNRRTETELLDAEKWLALMGKPMDKQLRNTWWDMAFVQFHDVFTGSHPDHVFQEVLRRLNRVSEHSCKVMEGLFGSQGSGGVRVVNSLPFVRKEWVSFPCNAPSCRVSGANGEVPSYVNEGQVHFLASIEACASQVYAITELAGCACASVAEANRFTLENEHMRLKVDAENGITLDYHGRKILRNVKDILVLQGDGGSFQFENPNSSERDAWTGLTKLKKPDPFTVSASGSFTDYDDRLLASWQLDMRLRPGDTALGLQLHINWQAKGQRLRLKIPTELTNTGDGLYEIPFGVVSRKPYAPAFNRKGEWPAQRFVTIENEMGGATLINTGAPGVEVLGSTLYTTLLRAPTMAYADMIPDATSDQHGDHDFTFALMPYDGSWKDAGLLKAAQCLNTPLRLYSCQAEEEAVPSLLAIDHPGVALVTVKKPEDESLPGIFLRVVQQTGEEAYCTIAMPGLMRAMDANMREELLSPLAVEKGQLHLHLKSWEIKTLYIERNQEV